MFPTGIVSLPHQSTTLISPIQTRLKSIPPKTCIRMQNKNKTIIQTILNPQRFRNLKKDVRKIFV